MALVSFPLPEESPRTERARLADVLEAAERLVRQSHADALDARAEVAHWRAQADVLQAEVIVRLDNLVRLIELTTANLLCKVDKLHPQQSLGRAQVRVLDAFTDPERVYASLELAEATSMSRRALGDVLRSLARRGLVKSVGYGQWRRGEG